MLTAADLPDVATGIAGAPRDQPLLARCKVRYMGEPIAAVAATDPHTAEDALRLIDIEYEVLPAVIDPRMAAEPSTALVHEGWAGYRAPGNLVRQGNIVNNAELTVGDVEQLARDRVVRAEDGPVALSHAPPGLDRPQHAEQRLHEAR